MYHLVINYYIPHPITNEELHETDCDNNGLFEMYSNNYDKLLNIRDLVSLDFLGKLSLYDIKGPIYSSNFDRKKRIKRPWDLNKKHEYIFHIDIYNSRQTGCEIDISLEDLYSGKLKKEYQKMLSYRNFIHEIPDLVWEIRSSDSLPENILENYIYYNKYIHFDENTFLEKVFHTVYNGNNIIVFLEKYKYKILN